MASPSPADIAAGVPAQQNIVARIPAPGGGEYLVGADGGVFATGGAKFAGSMPGFGPQGDSLYGKHEFNGNAISMDTDNGGYALTDAAGHRYDFRYNPSQAAPPPPNPLAQDPSHLAFMRTSGLGYDQAVRDFENQVGLNQRSNAAALAQLNDPFGQEAKGRQGTLQSYVDRGVAGGVAQNALTGYDTETAGKKAQLGTDLADENASAGQGFSKTVGDLSTAGTEEGIKTGTSQGWNQFLQGEAQKYPGQADKILGSGSSSGGA